MVVAVGAMAGAGVGVCRGVAGGGKRDVGRRPVGASGGRGPRRGAAKALAVSSSGCRGEGGETGGSSSGSAAAPGDLVSRRGVSALAAATLVWGRGSGPAVAGSNYPAGETGDAPVTWRPSARETPSIRAGQIKGYSFLLPPGWKQEQVANILSGNYCQPKCDEPWVEVIFSNKDSGKVNVFGCPSTKLKPYGFKPGMPIEDIASPESAIASLGGYATGNTIDPDSEVVSINKQEIKGKTYYLYEMLTPYAKTGLHQLAAVTSAQEAVLMFSVSATKDQWANAKDTLKQMVNSFEVDI